MSIHGLQRIPENEEFLQFYTVFENIELRDPKLGFSGVPTLIFLSFSHFWGAKKDTAKMAYAIALCEFGRDPYLAYGPRNSSSKPYKTRLRQSQPTTMLKVFSTMHGRYQGLALGTHSTKSKVSRTPLFSGSDNKSSGRPFADLQLRRLVFSSSS